MDNAGLDVLTRHVPSPALLTKIQKSEFSIDALWGLTVQASMARGRPQTEAADVDFNDMDFFLESSLFC